MTDVAAREVTLVLVFNVYMTDVAAREVTLILVFNVYMTDVAAREVLCVDWRKSLHYEWLQGLHLHGRRRVCVNVMVYHLL